MVWNRYSFGVGFRFSTNFSDAACRAEARSAKVEPMWWMYIGLGVVVASLVIFLFAMLAYSSTDMGESHNHDSHLKHR